MLAFGVSLILRVGLRSGENLLFSEFGARAHAPLPSTSWKRTQENTELHNYVDDMTLQSEGDIQEAEPGALHEDLKAIKEMLRQKNMRLNDDKGQIYWPTKATM